METETSVIDEAELGCLVGCEVVDFPLSRRLEQSSHIVYSQLESTVTPVDYTLGMSRIVNIDSPNDNWES